MSGEEFVRYRLGGPGGVEIDGRPHEHGTEVAVRVLAVVRHAAEIRGLLGAPLPATLEVRDWAGPWAEPHDPPTHVQQHWATVIAATVHTALHPEAPWDELPPERRRALAGFFATLVRDGVIDVGRAVREHTP